MHGAEKRGAPDEVNVGDIFAYKTKKGGKTAVKVADLLPDNPKQVDANFYDKNSKTGFKKNAQRATLSRLKYDKEIKDPASVVKDDSAAKADAGKKVKDSRMKQAATSLASDYEKLPDLLNALAKDIKKFYDLTLPQLGWVEFKKNYFLREQEILNLQVEKIEKSDLVLVKFFLSPKGQ